MRIGYNPNKDRELNPSEFNHQVVFPVYIPNLKGYFQDSLEILNISLDSLKKSVHEKTFITVVNNGSCQQVRSFLESEFENGFIHEVIHTENIGKINAILKGAVGHNFPLITISDADVLFLPNWQSETNRLFNTFSEAGVVGLIPQLLTYQYNCENFLFKNFWNSNVRFLKVKDPESIVEFYRSVGWDDNYPKQRLEYALGIQYDGIQAYLGSGHVVSTFKREIINEANIYSKYRMGGSSEILLDMLPSKIGYCSLTTYSNYAFHLGNSCESWMKSIVKDSSLKKEKEIFLRQHNEVPRRPSLYEWRLKKKVISFIFKRYKLRMLFLQFKGLPKNYGKYY